MIKIRLQRKGRIRRPIYHIVVADSRSPRDGRIIEQVGRYDGVTEKKETILNEDRIMYWLETGAQPTDSVRKILRREGLLYKRHLIMWGKSEEEIEAALAEWKAYRESKADTEVTRKEQVQASLAAEEKAMKEQVVKKAEKAAAELAAEEAVAETEEESAEAEATTEETTDEVAEEEATPEEAAEAVEEHVAEATEEPATEEVVEEESAEAEEAPAEEEAPEEEEVAEATEEPAEEAKAETEETSAQTSGDMTAKEAIEHINNTDLADLAGFVTDAEDRKTVLAAWESKQAD
ncbi:MAG: 30S ribosomal protein S16 [Balneolaceae bacterium]|nr:30S ribosomal protein S16 [Balneolaceae bacterium]MBO6545562.1 30S ribosomal protein S16 [Balneolaceae bacterium]MBO6646958.1 30S ribosomal protein S16 [Balneolaceae bacterium]